MLTIGLSVSSGIKLLERTLMVPFRSISRVAREAVYSATPAAEVAEAVVVDQLKPLGVAKTTMPERRLDFNQTFQHVRFELEALYKEQNPIFSNSAVPELWVNHEAVSARKAISANKHVDNTLGDATSLAGVDASTPALWISKTTMPDVRLDFNQTFERVRQELEVLYKAQNPNYKAESLVQAASDQPLHEQGHEEQRSADASDTASWRHRLDTTDRPSLSSRDAHKQAISVA